jgi:SAM-dependent methyltransferase
MAGAGWMTPAELAKKTSCVERYIREWLDNQAAGGYVEYDKSTKKYRLPDEHATALADDASPYFVVGAHQIAFAAFMGVDRMVNVFREGGGVKWGDQHPELFKGTERFFKPGYLANLVASWIPALDGVEAKLKKGARVADVGCGHGASTFILAKAYPASQFTGFDSHPASIEYCKNATKSMGLTNVDFQVADAVGFPVKSWDLIAHFDCFHDLGDPLGAAKRAREALAKDGTWMVIEPFAHDRPEDNHNVLGRVLYGASTMICVPGSLAFGGPGLGTQAGEARIREIATKAGFTRFRRAAETPFTLVYEARP